MVSLIQRHPGDETGTDSPGQAAGPKARADWLGWISLAWVIFWGWAYLVMVFQARGPQIVHWIGTLTSRAPRGG